MQKVVGVKFSQTGKVYLFNPNNIKLDMLDDVVVDSAVGLSYGTVYVIKDIDESDLKEPLKDVVRKATEADKKKYLELKEKASKDIFVVREKVKKLGLDMKIVSAQYSLDATKIIIDFSAEDRVDFRELLKELASALKVRIELHQVGQRDEVKIKGGIGPCGEICCCNRFLKDFEHVTVKMAKNQGLSLNPVKISGLCGRLMCCLAYENKTYEETLKKMPKINSEIETPKGKGIVVYNDILRERVSVKIKSNDDSFVVYDFGLNEFDGPIQVVEKTEVNKEVKKQPEKVQEKLENVQKNQIRENQNSQKRNKNKFKNKRPNKGDK